VLAEYLKLSFWMMQAKPIRSALSWLGVYIGVLALVIILAIHAGSREEMDRMYRIEGARIVIVFPGFDPVSKKSLMLGQDQARRLAGVPGVISVMPRVNDRRRVRSARTAEQLRFTGVDEAFLTLYRVPVVRGRIFLAREVQTRQAVCLMTDRAAQKLFPYMDAVGQTLDVEGVMFHVIGVLRWDSGVAMRAFGMETPDVLVPALWVQKSNLPAGVNLEVRVRPDMTPDAAVQLVRQALGYGNADRGQGYMVMTQEKFLESRKQVSDRTLYSLLAIAAISLLVGGIGIANVMLTSVTERTREVGLRKALGATRIDILFQFLVESIVLCGSGGLLAITTGAAFVNLGTSLMSDKLAMALPVVPLISCLAITLLIGLVAGLYPASRAAALSPAEALRYE
jgi:putative ABC transport system permease protein